MNTKIKNGNIINKRRKYFRNLVILMILWVVSLSSLATFSAYHLTKTIYNELGNKAMLLAIDIATRIELENSDVQRLINLDFTSLLKDPENMEFESKARKVMESSDIKYIYMESVLRDDQVKYYVEPGEEDLYGAPSGTPLNVIFLLDAVISDQVRMEDTDGQWYIDKDRYINLDTHFSQIFSSNESGYFFNKDLWGDYFTGYAPVHDIDGNILGIIGVDLFLTNYYELMKLDFLVVGGFTAANLIIGVILLLLHRKLRKADLQILEKTIQSNTDYLTSCLNRRSFIELAEQQWKNHLKSKRPMTIIFVDIDFFKEYNDHYGHLEGDITLSKVAEVLMQSCELHDSFVCRYGGDEFVILLSDTDEESAATIAQNILSGVSDLKIPHEVSPILPFQTVSIGISCMVPKDEKSLEILMDQADDALYKAKRYGRNRFQLWDGQPVDKRRS